MVPKVTDDVLIFDLLTYHNSLEDMKRTGFPKMQIQACEHYRAFKSTYGEIRGKTAEEITKEHGGYAEYIISILNQTGELGKLNESTTSNSKKSTIALVKPKRSRRVDSIPKRCPSVIQRAR